MTEILSPEQSSALLDFAGAIAAGDVDALQRKAATVLSLDVPTLAVDELVLQSVLTVGWPRALVAAGIWRREAGESGVAAAESDAPDLHTRVDRGEATCRTIYGPQYDRLRHNVRKLHPALDTWMVADGYGRTLSRPGLALSDRELCTVTQTVVLETPAQLHSHLLGALRAGATVEQVGMAVAAGMACLDDEQRHAPCALWDRVRASWKEAS